MTGTTTMKTMLFFSILFLSPVLSGSTGYDSKLFWNLPTSYSDGTPIDPSDVQKIIVRVYSGPTNKGPWNWIATSLPGATSATVIGPSVGQTLWFTAKTTLHGAESDYGVPVRKTNLDFLAQPVVKKAMEKLFTPRKMIALSSLLLLIASAWWIRRRIRSKGKRR